MKAKEFIIENNRSLIVEGTTVYEKQYKGYTIRVVDNRPKSKGFVGIAFKPGKNKIMDTFYVKTPKATPAEVEQELNVYVDGKRSLPNNSLTQFKSGNITMFFNAMLSKEIFAPDSVLYADIENVNGNPVLIISDNDQGGMYKVYDRNINKESGRGTGIFVMPRKKAITAGLTLSRYDLGREIDYGVPDVNAYELKWNSDVIPDEPLKLDGSGLTVSPPKKGLEMDETLMMSEVEDILNEAKKFAAEKMPKQRDPNWQTLQAKGTSGAGGKHIDKKRAEKKGDVKHKKQAIPMEGVAESKPGWMLKQDPKLAAKVKSKTDLAKKRQASYGDPSAGKSVDKKGVAEGSNQHISPSGVKTNMDPSDDDYNINYGKNGLVAKFRKAKGMAEGVDSEELANEVYAEFERIYPKLASRANQQTVHAAIMDVLNYGDDSNPSALAQDVARAVKRDIAQGVAEVSKSTIDRYVAKASDAHGHADFAARMSKDDPTLRSYHKDQKQTAEKRRQGISRALDRMSKNEGVSEAFQDKKTLEERLSRYESALKQARDITRVIKSADMHMEIINEIITLAKSTGIETTDFKYQINEVNEAVRNLQKEVYNLVEPFEDAVNVTQDAISELEDEEWQSKNRDQ